MPARRVSSIWLCCLALFALSASRDPSPTRAGQASQAALQSAATASLAVPSDDIISRYTHRSHFGGPRNSQVVAPRGLAIDLNGDIYVSEAGTHQVHRFSANGVHVGEWRAVSGQLRLPQGLALGSHGRLYLANSDSRVYVFNTSGLELKYLGDTYTTDAPGGMAQPWAVTTDTQAALCVLDREYDGGLHKFSLDGAFLGNWPLERGPSLGQIDGPGGIAADTQGNVYLADAKNHRIQKFSPDGRSLSAFGSLGSAHGQFSHPSGVAVGPDNSIYVCDNDNDRIQVFDSQGRYLRSWAVEFGGRDDYTRIIGISVDVEGNVLVANTPRNLVQNFSPLGALLLEFGAYGSGPGELPFPTGLALTGEGAGLRVLVSDPSNGRVRVFTRDGDFVTSFGGSGQGPGDFIVPVDITIDSSGQVYVVDAGNQRVQVFDDQFRYVRSWGRSSFPVGVAIGELHGISVSKDGFVYVTDPFEDRVHKFNTNGGYISGWSHIRRPTGVVASPSGSVYVTAAFGDVGEYTGEGGLIRELSGASGGLTLDRQGNLYVADRERNVVVKFDANTRQIVQFGGFGFTDGLFDRPFDLGVDSAGRIFVSDSSNHRVSDLRCAPWGSDLASGHMAVTQTSRRANIRRSRSC